MEDGAIPHIFADVFYLVANYFKYRTIALNTDMFIGKGIEWTAYSPYLNPLDVISVRLFEILDLSDRL